MMSEIKKHDSMHTFAFKTVGRSGMFQNVRSTRFVHYMRGALQSCPTRSVYFKNIPKSSFRGCYVIFSGTPCRISINLGSKEAEFAFHVMHVEIFLTVVTVVRYLVLNLVTTLEMALQSSGHLQERIRLGLSTLAEAVEICQS